MAGLYEDGFVEQLRQGLCGLTRDWGLASDCNVTTLNISENATFKAVDRSTGKPIILRVHRPGYHARDEIESELEWIHDLRREDIVATPKPLPRKDGSYIGSMFAAGDDRHVVAFEFMSGSEPAQGDGIVAGFRELGAISARLHRHARAWRRPSAFRRKTWNYETMLGATPLWGDWRDALGLDASGKAVLERTSRELQTFLAEFGEGPERFGLIHADLRLANLLVDGNRLGVIDFDDCGFSWFVYDFASAVSFFEHEPIVAELQDSWVDGYRSVAPLSDADVAAIPTFVMLRRFLLTAWVASHAETPTAQSLGAPFTRGTVELAEAFLSKTEQ
ncbi:phosphotransferase enzyme family protein [Hyphomicrobium sp.]|uniref:phosphotransferase enzyme family protein n=1 Tax=Hyphomicrobium sp. TaxID=82 RepID=UPI002E30C8F7|nr:phosphotransferase enzyme family protein [Hyphomicrobium sp.]HEX2841562.1 phosphotransferase enzyme family protein [Hyphomicrobium sp.]